ncbi:MAG: hypothetical protein HY868_01095 [Chloroflexi bacterium]|nr:hypothetical protein [Chloroflexota bacterium]
MTSKILGLCFMGLNILLIVIISEPVTSAPNGSWSVNQVGNEIQIAYGSGIDFPQYGVLHLTDSYLRMNYGPGSGWGTSIVLMPAFWSSGTYHHGAPISATWQTVNQDLVLSITGTIASLNVSSTVTISPPISSMISAIVVTTVTGNIPIDSKPGEAFKPATLSSMHISSTQWDAQAVYADCYLYPIPSSGWVIQPPVITQFFGIQGGTSSWKINAPSIDITLDQPLQVTGWITPSINPNDDNVGFWAASDTLMHTYTYKITASPSVIPHCWFLPVIGKNY